MLATALDVRCHSMTKQGTDSHSTSKGNKHLAIPVPWGHGVTLGFYLMMTSSFTLYKYPVQKHQVKF